MIVLIMVFRSDHEYEETGSEEEVQEQGQEEGEGDDANDNLVGNEKKQNGGCSSLYSMLEGLVSRSRFSEVSCSRQGNACAFTEHICNGSFSLMQALLKRLSIILNVGIQKKYLVFF